MAFPAADPVIFELSEVDVDRLLCHALIQRLEARGLPEAFETLAEMVVFHDAPPPAFRELPLGPIVSIQVGSPLVRPVFPVLQED